MNENANYVNKYLVNELDNYLNGNKKTVGAFYIYGDWGSGKTTFIKDYLNQKFSEQESNDNVFASNYVYVSLFGLRTISQVESKSFSNVRKRTNLGCKLLVLDDFERCDINVQELFSFINQNIEKGIQVVLIGYDEEVKNKLCADEDFKKKLILATITKNKKEYSETIEKEKNEKTQYEIIKEKSISEEYGFIFDPNIFFDVIIKKYDDETQKIVLDNREKLMQIISGYQCTNFRTCESALNYFITIIERINEANKKLLNKDIRNQILLSTFTCMISHRSKKKVDPFSGTLFQSFHDIHPFMFVNEYVKGLVWNYEKAVNEINSIKTLKKVTYSKTSPTIIEKIDEPWYEKTDNELKDQISELIKCINDKTLDVKYYPKALIDVSAFYDYGFDTIVGLEELTNIMISNVKENEEIPDYEDSESLAVISEKARPYIEKLAQEVRNYDVKKTIKSITGALNFRSKKALQKLADKRNTFVANRCFFSLFNIDDLYEFIRSASSSDVISIRRFISQVYSFTNLYSFFPNDKQNVDKLILLLTPLIDYLKSNKENIKARNLEWFVNDLKKYSNQLMESRTTEKVF